MIDKDHALDIARKLGALKEKSAPNHDIYNVYHDGKLIVTFGIRRGSRSSLGHDHMPRALHESPHNTRELAICNRSRDEWLEQMAENGYLPAPPTE